MVIRSSASPICVTTGGAYGLPRHPQPCRLQRRRAGIGAGEDFGAVDELSGFVIAVALVRPDKSIHNVEVKSVRKKMKDKAFAAKVSREDIVRGAERLGVPLEELIAEVIVALRTESDRLGVTGTPVAMSRVFTCLDVSTMAIPFFASWHCLL